MKSMGLAPTASQRDWRTIDSLEAAQRLVVSAFELLDGPGSLYSRCRELSEQIHSFQETFWPRVRSRAKPRKS